VARTSELPGTLVVVLGGAVAGTLVRQPNATLRFDYDEWPIWNLYWDFQ